MGGGNGAKAAHKREINAKDAKKAGSQLKTNAAAQSIQCEICKSTFQSTSKEAQLKLHSDNKHPKQTFKDCFPSFGAA